MASSSADVGVLAVLPDCELRAVLQAFGLRANSSPSRIENGIRYWENINLTRQAGRPLKIVVTAIVDAGNASSSAATTALMKDYDPGLVCLVGIAAGLPDLTKLGDAIVVKHVLGYEGERLEVDGHQERPTWRHPPSPVDLDATHFAGQVAKDELLRRIMHKTASYAEQDLPPRDLIPTSMRVRRGHIASGEKLFADGSLVEMPGRYGDSRIVAGEMEGIGFAVSAYREDCPWLIFRGISDHGDPTTKDGRAKDRFHHFASIAAAETMRMFLETHYTIPTLRYRSRRVASAIIGAPPVRVRTALFTVADKSGIEPILHHFAATNVRMIATPITARAFAAMGYAAETTFDFTRTPPIPDRRGTLHPYILEALAAPPDDAARLAQLKALGLAKIDLVLTNTKDPVSRDRSTSQELMDLLAQVQIGGPSLLRWAIKQWRTCAAVVDPQDYGALLKDLTEDENRLGLQMRAVLLTRALQYLARKDHHTARLLDALWPRATMSEDESR